MSNRTFPLAAALALGMAMVLQLAASAAERIGDIEVNVQPLPSKDNRSGRAYGTSHGYVEYRVQLKNSSTKDHVVYLSYPGTRGTTVSSGAMVSRTVNVAASQEVSVSLYQPPMSVVREAIEVRVEGVSDEKLIPVASLYEWVYTGGPNRIAVLLSRNVPQDFHDSAVSKTETKAATPAPTFGPSPPEVVSEMPATEDDRFAFLRSELPVGQWSANWLGYSCYDVIVMSGREAEEMPPQVQLAVRRFLECGGTLLIHGQDVPAAFSQGGQSDGNGGYRIGMGLAVAGFDGGKEDWAATHAKLAKMQIHVYRPAQKPFDANHMLIAEATVPVRGLFVLVLLFGLGIGPANLWLLSRYKRRIWLWWNVPAISLLTCLVVFGYSLASEGLIGHGKIASMTLLDERCHRAATFGYVSYYCPLTPSAGPRFGVDSDVALLDTEINPMRLYMRRESGDSLRLVDWTSDQRLTSGWVSARVPAYFQFRKNEDRRERLSVEKKADGSLKIVNALGADIRRLYLADQSGRVFEGQDIPAGAERTLTASAAGGLAGETAQTFARNVFTSADWLGGFHKSMESKVPAEMLSPGCYIAYLQKSPFVESPLPGVRSEDTAAIVFGISKGPDDGR
jgi:hypothetical protein